jgi:hypothetical protein
MTYVSGSFKVHCISTEPMESGKEFALGTRSLSGRYEGQKAVWEETDEAECFFPQFDWSVSNPTPGDIRGMIQVKARILTCNKSTC